MIKNFELPKKGAFQIPTKEFFKLHALSVAAGTRGSGKSVAVSNLLKIGRDKGYYDVIKLITPTYNSNKQIWDICYVQPEDVLEPNKECIKDFIQFVENDKKEWDNYLAEKELYEQYKKDRKKSANNIDDDLLLTYEELGFIHGKKPEWKYKDRRGKEVDHPPRIALIVDDCMGTPVYANNSVGLLNLCIKHRHIGEIGTSIYLLTQSYSAQSGINRAIRENTTLLLLFKNKDEAQIQKICSEIGTDVSTDKFLEYFRYATKEPHNFLTIDFHPSSKDKTFLRNFSEYLNF